MTAQTETKPDRIVYFFGSGDAVLDQPKCFTPNGLQKTICDVGINFLPNNQWFHSHIRKQGLGPGSGLGCADQFHERQKVNRVKRVSHKNLLRVFRFLLEFRRLEPGS